MQFIRDNTITQMIAIKHTILIPSSAVVMLIGRVNGPRATVNAAIVH